METDGTVKMLKNIHIWIFEHIRQSLMAKPSNSRPVHVIFSIVDHFEPRWGNVGIDKEIERVDKWISKYEPVARRHKDGDGNIPQYTFFYPIDEYTPLVFEKMARFCEKGFGEIEVQLHHDNDTEYSLRKKLEHAKDVFGKSQYGFVHGNWSLGNSRKDGKWCGVNNELAILKETGCYADFTLPSAPSATQTRKINSIYYAKDTNAPKPHNTGIDVEARKTPDNGLMIIQGPLALNWHRMKIENGSISLANPPTQDRVDLWIKQRVSVKGRPDWIFVKVYTHGAQDNNLKEAYFNNLDKMFDYLEERYNDGERYKLHYVTTREMYNIVKAAEALKGKEPEKYRNYLLSKIPAWQKGKLA
ncbi:MAG: hypothetical protein WC522_02435 [Candidatus Omnitrophota bacterium]